MLKRLSPGEVEAIHGGARSDRDVYDFVKDAILSPWEVAADGVHDMFVNPKNIDDCGRMKSENNQKVCENYFDQQDKQQDNAKVIWMMGEHDLSYNTAARLKP